MKAGVIALVLVGCTAQPPQLSEMGSARDGGAGSASVDAGVFPEPRPFAREGGNIGDAAEPDSAVDGAIDVGTGAECDSSRACDANSACSTDAGPCTARCGDGFVSPGERCDGDGLGHPGETAECNADCTLAVCGDGVVNTTAGESCDDGNGDDTDDCPDGPHGACKPATCSDGLLHDTGNGSETDVDCGGSECAGCPARLSLSEIAVTPTLGEYVELYNPGDSALSLTHVYLADSARYAEISAGLSGLGSSDFVARFPDDAVIAPQSYLVVSLESASAFHDLYGRYPDYDLDSQDPAAPDLVGAYGASSGLTNSHEMVALFWWDGRSPTVRDLDYVVYGDTSDAVDKTSVVVSGVTYVADTAAALQRPALAPDTNGESLVRCDFGEGSEPTSGGNGWLGHDETGEDLDVTWRVTRTASPGAPNACP